MRFTDIIGHREAISRLRTMADSGKLPHALLLYGPSGIGKTALARALVQYVNCTSPSGGDSCGHCPSCLLTSKLNNPDIHYIFPVIQNARHPKGISEDFMPEWTQMLREHPFMAPEDWLSTLEAGNSTPMIYVHDSEAILRDASLSPYGHGKKIFFIWQPEKMNEQAANKLLKVIEEPFEDTLFVLVSNNAGAILPTVRSRLQGIELSTLSAEDITGFLVGKGLPYEQAASLAPIARGNLNVAAGLADTSGETASFTVDFIKVMRSSYSRNMPELRDLSDRFAGYGREKGMRLLSYFARMLRESFISNLHSPALETMLPDEKSFVERFGPFIHAANVEEMSREVDRARLDISRNANQKVVWFDLLIHFTRLIRTNLSKAPK